VLAPVILFTYNRPKHTINVLEALNKNNLAKDTILYIFQDGPKKGEDFDKINETIDIIKSKNWCKEYILEINKNNKGLANSIIEGVTKVIEKHNKVIVLEDDLITSPFFLDYMNDALNFYENNEKVGSISGFNYPEKNFKIEKSYNKNYFFSLRPHSWGWGTWKNKWIKSDWAINDFENFDIEKIEDFNKGGSDLYNMLKNQKEGKIDSWAIRWAFTCFNNNWMTVYPVKSLVYNIGFDGSGTHNSPNFMKSQEFVSKKIFYNFESEVKLNEKIVEDFKNIFEYQPRLIDKVKKHIKNIFK
jgi:hypothetical protein